VAKVWRDIRLALPVFRKTPAMTAVALVSLAQGIGANTAIFSLLNAVLLRTLPVPHPKQIVALSTSIFDITNSFPLQIFMGIVGVVLFIACLNIANLSLAKAAAHRHQSGVQAALGASQRNLLVMVLRDALLLAAAGCAAGVAASLEAGKLIKSILFGVPLTDAASLIIAVLTTLSVAAAAAFIPARSAAQTDPMTALRAE